MVETSNIPAPTNSPAKAPPLGAHTSIAGGLYKAIFNGKEIGCDVVQIFSKNQRQWKSPPLADEQVAHFKTAVSESGVRAVAVHDSYLINLAGDDSQKHRLSLENIIDDLQRCERLQIPYLVMHPGSNSRVDEGISRIANSLKQAFDESKVSLLTILLETTAGQGASLGHSFEQLQEIIIQSGLQQKIAVCVDTCHIFAAGYDLRSAKSWEETKNEFNRVIGLEKLRLFHLNGCKRELGSRIDRHERIGRGSIGLEGFRAILSDPELQEIPMILEIPGGETAYREDLILLRKLSGSS